MNLRRFLGFLERRKVNLPVAEDRRKNHRWRHEKAAAEAKDALSKFEETVRMKREDFFKREAINDKQTTVIFSTYREICYWKGPEIGGMKICRHKGHPDAANHAVCICDEDKCPTLALAMKGQAA